MSMSCQCDNTKLMIHYFLCHVVPQVSNYDLPKKEKRQRKWRSKNNGKETKSSLQVQLYCHPDVQVLLSPVKIKWFSLLTAFLFGSPRSRAVFPPSQLVFTPPTPTCPPPNQTPRTSVPNPRTRPPMCPVCRRTSAGWLTTVSSSPSCRTVRKKEIRENTLSSVCLFQSTPASSPRSALWLLRETG